MSVIEMLTRAIRALADLEAAIEAGNKTVVEARLYELGRILQKMREELK